jgi:hypothetical protein
VCEGKSQRRKTIPTPSTTGGVAIRIVCTSLLSWQKPLLRSL